MGIQESRLCQTETTCRVWFLIAPEHEICTAEECSQVCKTRASHAASEVPLILHFDVNKTIILSDSISMKGVQDSIREGISELFWGEIKKADSKTTWEWTGTAPSVEPPVLTGSNGAVGSSCNYRQYCKQVIKDSAERKKAVRSWELVNDMPVQEEMYRLMEVAMQHMQWNLDVKDQAQDPTACGVAGHTYNMLPAFFHFVAALQQTGRSFAVLFRSFGADHETVKNEWNAFCELRHPLFSGLIKDTGPWDGTDPSIPDRRIHSVHTLYRDERGPMLILDTFTNGPKEASWDSWAKKKPPPEADTRQGREYVKEVLKAKTVEGFPGLQSWMQNHLQSQSTASIKDDWAWWHRHDEQYFAGKVLPLIGGDWNTRQLFFDDNIEHDDPRIVDCRDPEGGEVPRDTSLSRMCVKVNPIEALLNKDYFLQKLKIAEASRQIPVKTCP